MSHLQGTDYVGSMVVFEDGLAKRSDYRRFKVKTVPGNDDYAAMEEVLTRRLTALKERRRRRRTERPRRFAYRPNLLLVDGGKGQLGVAERVVRELGLEGEIELAALAKQFEEVYRPGSPDPVRLRRGSDALYLLQRVRDEAHRFAITFHRERRAKRMTAQHARRHPGPRPGPQGPPGQGARVGSTPSGPPRSRSSWRALAARRRRSGRLRRRAQGWGGDERIRSW